ncbi:polymorphic toxin type 28 domain-containing protein [Psychrobium sp. MM17-31]|uniref:polymorphic toxin type 28 domain-containing protein n=1 Tax=Psychrobium sp. MM17-31 TaxID=2917758 RepID=UPI001EF60DF2|nr:polymorphic toxin type 28 domain-containing protein [Psychrobium sp. MM17-31]
MKLFIKLMLALVIIAVGGLFILKKPDGTPWLNINDFTPSTSPLENITKQFESSLNDAQQSAAELIGDKSVENKPVIYRWKNQDGNWQMSDLPPTDGTPFETVHVEQSGNIIDLSAGSSQVVENNKPSVITNYSLMIPTPTTTSSQQTKKLIEDAKNIQSLLDKRAEKIKAATESTKD